MTRRLLLVHATPSAVGGSERSMLLGARELSARGWELVLLHGEHGPPAVDEGLFSALVSAPQLRAGRAIDVAAALREAGIGGRMDLSHVHFGGGPALLRGLQRLLPTVVTAHLPVCPNGSRFNFVPQTACARTVSGACLTVGHRRLGCGHTGDGAPFGLPAMARAVLRAKGDLTALGASAAVIAPSRWQRDRLALDGVPPEVLHVIAPPIPPPGPPGDRDEPPVLVFAGRLFSLKGAADLLEASARVARDHRVVLVGDGPERAALAARAERLGIAGRVRFLGAVAPAQVGEVLASATVAVVPSRWPETFGMAGPEAMAAGTPVVAYAHAGVADWLEHEVDGLAVAPYDIDALAAAIARLLGDEGLRGRLRDGGRRRALTLGVERHAEATSALYERVLSAAVG